MVGLLDGIDKRTNLAGHNRIELLLFRLESGQRFGINVFKVQEAIQCPVLTQVPRAHSVVCGIANLRGKTVSIIDLSMAIGGPPHARDGSGYVIITEFNRAIHGFLVASVEQIIHLDWSQIYPAPKGVGPDSYMTAVTRYNNELLEIVDVEKVLTEVIGVDEHLSDSLRVDSADEAHHVLVVDDSSVARHQVRQVLDALKVTYTLAKDGQEAWDRLQGWLAEGKELPKFLSLVISDIEMPRMDGYTLTTRIRSDPRTAGLYILLHSSLSGVFNQTMVEKVGADKFLAKFVPNELATLVKACLTEHRSHSAPPA